VIRSAFLSFYRSLTRHPLYAGLNLLGLSFGIAVFIVLSLFVRFETSYEQWLPNADRIYVVTHLTEIGRQSGSAFLYSSAGYTLDAVHTIEPRLAGSRIYPAYLTARRDAVIFSETGQLVDNDFFSVFDLPVRAGDRQAALAAPDGLILSESMARKYFGTADVIGEKLYIHDDRYEGSETGEEKAWRVLAVLKDLPANSVLKLDMVRSLKSFRTWHGQPWGWYAWGRGQEGQTFIVLPNGESAKKLRDTLAGGIKAFPVPWRSPSRVDYRKFLQIDLQPLKGQHLSDTHRQAVVYGLSATATLALMIALINYLNLGGARMAQRAHEVIVRSIHGAARKGLIAQFVIEAALTAVASLVIAVSLVEIGLPAFNGIGNLALKLDYGRDGLVLAELLLLVMGCILVAGAFSSIILAGLRTSGVVASLRTGSRNLFGRYLREGLTVVQFGAVGAFFALVMGFGAQLQHLETSDLGFNRDGMLITGSLSLSSNYNERLRTVLAEWRRTSGIEAVTSGLVPGIDFMMPFYATSRGHGRPEVLIGENWVAEDFFRVYKTPVLAGRPTDLSDDVARSDSTDVDVVADRKVTANVNINVSAMRALGFSSPQAAIGQDLVCGRATLHIVGVVADQHFQDPAHKVPPTLYGINTADTFLWDFVVRYSGIDETTARQRLAAVWTRIMPDRPLEFITARQALDYYYRDHRRNTRLFAIGGGVAALIGAVGLFGMAAFSTSARVHEIGIRKASGATRGHIVRLLMFQFLRPVLIANLIAWPVAYVVLDGWLKQFDDRVAMSPWFFVAGSGLSLVIAAVTVVGVAVSAASLSPAKALRQL